MYTPGTIKAIGLMSKGVSSDRAFAEGRNIDLQAAQTRINFYTQESLKSSMLTSLPSTAYSASVNTPGIAATTPAKVTNPTPSTTVSKTWDDMVKEGYKRNTGDGSYLANAPGMAQVPVATGSQKKLKTFFDDRYMPTQKELEQQTNLELKDDLLYINNSLKNNGWGVKNANEGIQVAAQRTASILSKPVFGGNLVGDLTSMLSPEKQAQVKEQEKQRVKSFETSASNYFKSTSIPDLVKSKKLLYADIDSQLKDLEDQSKYWTSSAIRGGDQQSIKDSQERVGKITAKKLELNKLKNSLEDTYEKRVTAIKSKEAVGALEQLRTNFKTDEDFLKGLDSFKNKAGGLATVNSDFTKVLKDIYNENYLDRALTQADIEVGGKKVMNEVALQRFLEGTPLTTGALGEVNESRYDGFKADLIKSHLQLGQGITTELTNKVITAVKRQEQLVKEAESSTITPKRLEEIQKEVSVLQQSVDFNKKLIDKTSEIHNPEAFKTNKELTNFLGTYVEREERKEALSKFYFKQDYGVAKGAYIVGRTGQKVAQGVAQQFLGNIVEGLGGATGWEWLETKGRRFNNAVSVEELVNFDKVNSRGQYQTTADFIFEDAQGNREYNPSALVFQGGEMLPLIVGSMYGGGAIAGGAGRLMARNLKTLTAKGMMSSARAAQFSSTLAKTGSYRAAFQNVTAASKNPLVQQLSARVPNAMSMTAIVYPQQFVSTYRDLYEKGVENARTKAHAIASISTGIEVLTENIFPDMKYLDDFAEKGVFGKSWVGSYQQYRTLYGNVFGDAFSPKTLDYLATRSLNLAGKGTSVGRFMLARGTEEGIEEVSAELMNFFADNEGLANLKGEPAKELTVDGLITAFSGSYFTFPLGAGKQIKAYNENRKYGEMYDIMLNAQYYKNKIDQELKAGKITADKAATALGKIQELEAIEKEYGVRNLKNLDNKKLEQLTDLMEDEHLQFDYFKSILKKNSIDEKLTSLDKQTYTEDQKKELIAMSEEAAKTIDQYKKKSDFYSQLTDEDKKAVLDNSINGKLQLTRFARTEDIEHLGSNLEDYAATVVAGRRPGYFVDSIRQYRDNVKKIKEEREQAEQDAIAAGTYNPLVDAIENKTPTTTPTSITSQDELQGVLAQAVMAPDRGGDLVAYFNGSFDQQLEAIEADTERVTAMFLDSVSSSGQSGDTIEMQPDGTEEISTQERDPIDNDKRIADLTEEQQEELAEMLSELNNQYDDILERKQTISRVVGAAIDAVAPSEIMGMTDATAQTEAYSGWIKDLLTKVTEEAEAVRQVMADDTSLAQSVFYDKISYLEYKADNKEKIDKKLAEIKKIKEERKAAETPTAEETRNNVTAKEKSEETGKEVSIEVPELIQSDVTPEFAQGLTALESMPKSRLTATASQAAGDIVTDEEYNAQRGVVIQNLLGEVLGSTSLDSALAKMYSIMEAAEVSVEEKAKTLELMKKVANSEPVLEEDYTHMFELLLIKANLDLGKLKFTGPAAKVEAPAIVATQVDERTAEEIERTTAIPNVQLGTLEGKLVEYNGVRGTLVISEGGIVTVETDNTIYELTGATKETSSLEHMIQEVVSEMDSKESDDIISETEVMLDNVEYLIETDARGNVVGLRDKRKPQKKITNNKLLIRAEVLRNRLEHQVITETIETTPELIEDIAEAVQEIPSAQIVENLFTFNMTDNVASGIDKLYEDGNNTNLTEAELLETELWVMDAWYKLDDLAKEYPEDEVFQNAIENLLIINKLLYNGQQRKSTRKAGPKKPAEAKERRTAPKKEPSKTKSKSPIVKESAKPTQLTLDFSTPTPVVKEAKTKKAEAKITLPAEQPTPETNVTDTVVNNQKVVSEVKVEVAATEEAKSEVQSKNQILNTQNLKMPISPNNPDAGHLRVQEKIIQSVNKEHRTAKPAIVDLFTMVEQVLGPETLTQMEAIFDEVQLGVDAERKAVLRSQFLSLFPTNFMKPTAAAYMFDTQIVNKVSQSDLTQVNEINLNATEEEIYQYNKNRLVPEVELKDGRKIKNMRVKQSEGKLLFLKEDKTEVDGKEVTTKTWVTLSQVKDPTKVLQYPIKGVTPMSFNALNVLTFTMLDNKGEVQRYNNEGDKTESGDKALLIYLPTSKAKANPTPQQLAMSGLRAQIVEGKRVVHQVELTGPSVTTSFVTKEGETVPTNGDYEFEFSTETLTPVEATMTPAEVIEDKVVEKTIAVETTQEKSVAALEALIAKAKTIPDPSKEGYLIDGERYERQSGFTKRVMGKTQVDTEDSVLNMEKGAAVGNLLDIIGRDVLGGRTVKSLAEYIKEAEGMGKSLREGKGYKLEFTQEQFDALVAELESVKKELTRQGYKVYTEGLVIYRKYNAEEKEATGYAGVAGAMDIVAVDKDGGVHIIDFKNKKFKNTQTFKSSMYNSNERFPSNISKWGTQQTAYGVLSGDFGLPIRSINILAFASQYEESDGVITVNMLSKGSDQVPVLAQNKSDISDSIIRLKYDSKIAAQINSRTVKPTPQPLNKEADKVQLEAIKENVPDLTDSEARNASLVLSSLGMNLNNVKSGLDSKDENPTTKNPPTC